jgi:hypothetical protein
LDLQQFKTEFVSNLLNNQDKYFENVSFLVAGEYENLCVKITALAIERLTSKNSQILSEFSFKN